VRLLRPVGRLEVKVAAQELVEGRTGGMGHFGVGGWGAVVPFVVFAGTGEGGEFGLNVGRFWGPGSGGLGAEGGGGAEGDCRWAFGGVGHENEAVEEVWAGESAEVGGHGAEVVADNGGSGGIAQRGDEGDGIFDQVEGAEGVARKWFGGVSAAVASLVEGDGMVALGGEEGEDLAPRIGKLGEAVNAKNKAGVGTRVGW
jgi:hypothetical protein